MIPTQFCGLHTGPRPPGHAYTTKFIMLVHTYLYCKQRSKGRRGGRRAHTHTLTPRGFIYAPEMLMAPSAGQAEHLPRGLAGKGQKEVDGRTVGKHLLFTVLRGLTEIYSQVVRWSDKDRKIQIQTATDHSANRTVLLALISILLFRMLIATHL